MTLTEVPTDAPVKIDWSGTVLNVHTITLLLVCPFWSAFLLTQGKALAVLVMVVLLAGMIGLCLVDKPMLTFDPKRNLFISPDGETFALDQLHAIEMDTRDIYFIPKSHAQSGWHLSQRCWVLSPRRSLQAAAKAYGWPLKDIAHPVSRFGFWLVP